MRILDIQPSRESCVEPDWIARDIFLDSPIDERLIRSLGCLGSLVYLSMLKRPFFKVERDDVFLKGIQGDQYFRFACAEDRTGTSADRARRIEKRIELLRELMEDRE